LPTESTDPCPTDVVDPVEHAADVARTEHEILHRLERLVHRELEWRAVVKNSEEGARAERNEHARLVDRNGAVVVGRALVPNEVAIARIHDEPVARTRTAGGHPLHDDAGESWEVRLPSVGLLEPEARVEADARHPH